MGGRQKTDAKREEILAAAAEEFARREFHEVLMDDVAAHAHVGKGTLYRYFPTKEELFVATVLRGLDDFHERFLQMFEDEAPLERILVDAISQMLAYFRGRSEFFALLQRYEHRLPPADAEVWRERRQEVVRAVSAALDREVQAGALRSSCDTTLSAELFLGMARTAIQSSLADARDPAHVAREISSVFLDGVREKASGERRGSASFRFARGGRS
ncbi:MAG TPA: TetR/AcrR family transcriptional regulator [Candidatus Binatia bacterium]|nr:TetR/AcrR family transcriptional regulator [Candidatus Binatia bacterium]